MNSEVSDVEAHMKVTQIRIEKIRYHVVCIVHTVMEGGKVSERSLNVGLLIVPN